MDTDDLMLQCDLLKKLEHTRAWLNTLSYDNLVNEISAIKILDIGETRGYAGRGDWSYCSVFVIPLTYADKGKRYNVYMNGEILYTVYDSDNTKLFLQDVETENINLNNIYKTKEINFNDHEPETEKNGSIVKYPIMHYVGS